MTTTPVNRVQTFRSIVTGVVPATGARQPGELWVNLADLQLGAIDESKVAQKITAVRYFSITANYAAGDFVIQGGNLYVANAAITAGAFNPTQWTAVAGASISSLPLSGGTMTGPLILSGDPTVPLGAATKQYVDNTVEAAEAEYLPLTGGTVTGAIILPGNPTSGGEAADKTYVDAGDAVAGNGRFLPLSGGTVTGAITLPANPTTGLQAATKQYVDVTAAVPAGCVMDYAGPTTPAGWLLCNGASLLRASYPALFAAIGGYYGAVDGAHFSLPNCLNRMTVGAGSSYALASGGGEANHTLLASEMPSHVHGDPGHTHGAYQAAHSHNLSQQVDTATVGTNVEAWSGVGWAFQTVVTDTQQPAVYVSAAGAGLQAAGGGAAHNNMPPYIAMYKIIKY